MLKSIGTWTVTLILVLFFLQVSYRKFSGNEITVGHFREWGYARWLLLTVATLELAGAILLLFPITASSGALLLSLVLTGATYTLISHQVWKTAFITCTCLLLLLVLGYLRWQQSWILTVLRSGA
jgi:uncharacterized membrane protein YphA (DoxX/SURF4 family)